MQGSPGRSASSTPSAICLSRTLGCRIPLSIVLREFFCKFYLMNLTLHILASILRQPKYAKPMRPQTHTHTHPPTHTSRHSHSRPHSLTVSLTHSLTHTPLRCSGHQKVRCREGLSRPRESFWFGVGCLFFCAFVYVLHVFCCFLFLVCFKCCFVFGCLGF